MEDKSKMPIIIAVDGPAGSGKSSICEEASKRLNWDYLNSGAIYRVVGLLAKQQNLPLDNDAEICKLMEKISSQICWDLKERKVFFAGQDLTNQINSAEAGVYASKVATLPKLRSNLLPFLRKIALQAEHGIIIDGRDIGTVVFPEADLKVFLTASVAKRAERRLQQLKNNSQNHDELPSLESLLQAIKDRDTQDSQRQAAPLTQSMDAILLDNSTLNFEESIEKLISLIRHSK